MEELVAGESVTFEDWAKIVPGEIREDSVWRVEAYRLALFVADLGWDDVTRFLKDCRTLA
jgi:hypothetical protein